MTIESSKYSITNKLRSIPDTLIREETIDILVLKQKALDYNPELLINLGITQGKFMVEALHFLPYIGTGKTNPNFSIEPKKTSQKDLERLSTMMQGLEKGRKTKMDDGFTVSAIYSQLSKLSGDFDQEMYELIVKEELLKRGLESTQKYVSDIIDDSKSNPQKYFKTIDKSLYDISFADFIQELETKNVQKRDFLIEWISNFISIHGLNFIPEKIKKNPITLNTFLLLGEYNHPILAGTLAKRIGVDPKLLYTHITHLINDGLLNNILIEEQRKPYFIDNPIIDLFFKFIVNGKTKNTIEFYIKLRNLELVDFETIKCNRFGVKEEHKLPQYGDTRVGLKTIIKGLSNSL